MSVGYWLGEKNLIKINHALFHPEKQVGYTSI